MRRDVMQYEIFGESILRLNKLFCRKRNSLLWTEMYDKKTYKIYK